MASQPAVWFPAIRAGSGTDIFTERLAAALEKRGIRTAISWLPHRAEFSPWSVAVPSPPPWATVVHCNSWLHRRFVPGGLPLVATLHSCIHDPSLDVYKSSLQSLYHRWWVRGLESAMVARAQVVTAVSRYTAERGAEVFGRPDIRTVYNWIDTGTFHPARDKKTGNPFRLLYVGNMRRLKGADLLAPVMSRLGDDFVLHYTGNRDELGEASRLPANMVSLGRLAGEEQLLKAYHDADALFFPSRVEGFGLSAIEAQACGLPVISTASSSIPEVVADGASGLLCPVDDIDAMVAAAKKLKEDAGLRERLSRGAIEHAGKFSEEAAVSSYIDIYTELTG